MNTREFVELVRREVAHLVLTRPPLFVECDKGRAPAYLWTFSAANGDSRVWRWLSKSSYIALVYPDGSAQLLSRDEGECLLFAALWELER